MGSAVTSVHEARALTPALFRELDVLARTAYGCVLVVATDEELGGLLARYSHWAASVYIDASVRDRPGCCTQVPAIQITNRLSVRKFAAGRSFELNNAAVAPDDIFRFLLHHEAGHRLHNFSPIDFLRSRFIGQADERRWRFALHRANEVLADRFAWAALYPGRPFPRAPGHTATYLAQLDQDIVDLRGALRLGGIAVKPLPTSPGAYVPAAHATNGIPWA